MLAIRTPHSAAYSDGFRISCTPGGLLPLVVLGTLFAVVGKGSTASLLAAAAVGAAGGALSLIVHELGHVLASRRVRSVKPTGIALIWGGAATYFEGAYRTGREQIRVAIGGPAASLLAAATIAGAIPVAPAPARFALFLLALLNAAVGVLTLVPVAPLDGYKIVFGLAWSALGSEERARAALKRVGTWALALDLVGVAIALAERPLMGALGVVAGAGLFVQRRLARRWTPA